MVWVLSLLFMTAAVAYFVWDYRKKAAAREAASKKRFEEMFMARAAAAAPAESAPAAAAPAVAAPPPEPKAASPEPKAAPAAAGAAVAAPARDHRFLGKAETLIYRLLKAGVPDHEVFANVSLATVLGSRSEQEARRLAQYRLDFVVCDKNMRVVAAVDVESAALSAGEQRFKAESLKAAGIGLVHVNPSAPPRREEIRALVCGQPPAG